MIKRKIFINGVFDILHVGHVRLFQFAKLHGDYLIVGLNSDESVKLLKGGKRPIISQNYREEMLESIKFVDEVIIFDETDPCELIKKIKPDILVKGEDWKDKNIIERNLVDRIIFFPHNGISTTKIINKIGKGD